MGGAMLSCKNVHQMYKKVMILGSDQKQEMILNILRLFLVNYRFN